MSGVYKEDRLRDIDDATFGQFFHEEPHVRLDELHVAVVTPQLTVASVLWYYDFRLVSPFLLSDTQIEPDKV